ncbi:PAXNEB-domain-containing protein, partial [Coprinopsis marcescibilis]
MSSFKRKNSAKVKTVTYPGTRVSAASSSTINVSTGVSSLDDILGGGLPLSCSLVIAAPDLHSSYGQLAQNYFIAEGLACGHRICVVDGDPSQFLMDTMWFPKSTAQKKAEASNEGSDENESEAPEANRKVKIAWRYEQMKQFQTTVSTPVSNSENYCHVFDLACRLPQTVREESERTGTVKLLHPPSHSTTFSATPDFFEDLERFIKEDASLPVRLCIPSLGSPSWGDLSSQDTLYFLNRIRVLLRKYPHACASITLTPHLSTDQWGGPGWLQKIGWLTDAALSMAAFSADPTLSSMFPSHHGIVRLLSLPSPATLVPPSDRFSTLRGLSSSSSASGGTGENNLAFKCTRKRLIFETLHLDLEGGVSERRTSAPSSATAMETNSTTTTKTNSSTGAKISIQLEGVAEIANSDFFQPQGQTIQPSETKP